MSPVTSVVICTHNRAAYLAKAIQSVVDQCLPWDDYEVIVVDNRSTDDTREVVDRFSDRAPLRYVFEPMLGLSRARNAGWRNAHGRYVAYLDDDAVAAPGWLRAIRDTFETVVPTPGCVGGRVAPIWEAPRPPWLSDEILTSLTVIDWSDTPHVIQNLDAEWLVGANIAFPRDVLTRMDGFHPGLDRAGTNLLSGGDVFLQKQIARAGYDCFYQPTVAVSHHVPAARLRKSWFVRRYYWQGVSDAAMQITREHPSARHRAREALVSAARVARSPHAMAGLVLPGANGKRFTRACFTLIAGGHVTGLLGAARR